MNTSLTVPASKVVTILRSRENPLYEGTAFSVSCVITPNRTGVDTDFEVQRNFSGPETSTTDRITLLDIKNNIQISLMFVPLIVNDTGTYECSAIASSVLSNVTASDPVMNDTSISILCKYSWALQCDMAYKSTLSSGRLFDSCTCYEVDLSWRHSWNHWS